MPALPAGDLGDVVDTVGDRFRDLRGARILLGGAGGFWGRWLLESLLVANRRLDLGARVVVLARDPARFRESVPHLAGESAIDVVEGDVRRFPAPESSLSHVIHAASVSSRHTDPLDLADVIVAGTKRMLDVAVERGAKRFLFASSGAVYGAIPPEVTHAPETLGTAPDPLVPGSAYGTAKRMAEQLCVLYRETHGLEPVLARGFAFVGPLLPVDTHFAIGNFVRDALAGGPIRVGGDGTPWRSWLYASDLAAWLWTMLLAAPAGRAFNVGSEDARTIAEGAREVGRIFGVPVEIAKQPTPGAAAQRYVPSTARARTELGLSERISLEEGIRRTARWLAP